MSRRELSANEMRFLENASNSGIKKVNIRLREGEYQFDLAKAIASFALELWFPDVKELIRRLYGEAKAEDIQFIRKIQTILKKMEKSGMIRILPKKKPWELQKYALSSFKFQDVEKNLIVLVSESEAKGISDMVNSTNTKPMSMVKQDHITARILVLTAIIVASYGGILWMLTQPSVNPVLFVLIFSLAATCSMFLGISLSRRK